MKHGSVIFGGKRGFKKRGFSTKMSKRSVAHAINTRSHLFIIVKCFGEIVPVPVKLLELNRSVTHEKRKRTEEKMGKVE